MLQRVLALVGIALFVISCSKDTTPADPGPGVTFDNTVYIKASFDGSAFTPLTTNSRGKDTLGNVFFNLACTGSTVVTLSATVPNSATGTYTLGSGVGDVGVLTYTKIEITGGTTYATTDGATGTIIIDKIDASLKRVKGRFSGTVKNSDGGTMNVTNGTFEANW